MDIQKIRSLLNRDCVIDNNVLVDFSELGCIAILDSIFASVAIPQSIIDKEVIHDSEVALKGLGFSSVSITTDEGYVIYAKVLNKYRGLSEYDAELIAIAAEKKLVCVSNEKAITTVCRGYKVETTGTIGILCSAYENRILAGRAFAAHLDKLFSDKCTCFISPKLQQEVLTHYVKTIPEISALAKGHK